MLNIGLIGFGKMGMSHLAIANAHPDVNLIGVCDTSSYIRGVLNKYTGISVYSDYRALLDIEGLEAVIIATPSRFHAEMVRSALERELHVFCEKPFCLDVTDGMQLADLAQKKGVINQVGYHLRFVTSFKEAKRLVNANSLGHIHHIRVEAYGPVILKPKGSTWRTTGSEGGGCLYDYACHAIDIVNFLIGRPQAVSGAVLQKIFSRDVDDEVYATLHFDGGMTGQLAANWSDESFRRMSIQVSLWGTNGRMIVDRQEIKTFIHEPTDPSVKPGWNARYITDLPNEVWYYLRGEEYSAQIDYFIQCIKESRKDSVSSFATAIETDLVVSMILQNALGSTNTAGLQATSQIRNRPFLGRLKDALP